MAGTAEATTKKILDEIRARVQAAMPEVAAQLQKIVAAESPTPDEEYRAIMVGEGGAEYEPPPLAGNRSADDPTTGRVRFEKEPGTFLQEMAVNPENVLVGDDQVSIGNIAFLMEGAKFSFKDFNPKRPRPGQTYPTDFFTSASYFEAFEYGTSDGSGWTGEVSADGTWRLRPDDVDRHYPDLPRTMSKPIHARLAYSPAKLDTAAKEILDGILDESR